MLDADAAPMVERFARRCDRGFRLRNSRFGHGADDLFRRAGIDRVDEVAGPNFLAIDHERIFLTQTSAHFAKRRPHLFLIGAMHPIYERRVFETVARLRAYCGWRRCGNSAEESARTPRAASTPVRASTSEFGSRSN